MIYSVDKTGGLDLITEKYGITGSQDRLENRPQYQVNKFNKEDPSRHFDWKEITKKPNRIQAKEKETEMVLKYKILHRGRLPRRQYRPNPDMPAE